MKHRACNLVPVPFVSVSILCPTSRSFFAVCSEQLIVMVGAQLGSCRHYALPQWSGMLVNADAEMWGVPPSFASSLLADCISLNTRLLEDFLDGFIFVPTSPPLTALETVPGPNTHNWSLVPHLGLKICCSYQTEATQVWGQSVFVWEVTWTPWAPSWKKSGI